MAPSSASAAKEPKKTKEEKDIITIPTFNGQNYSNWQNAMSAYLEYKQLWFIWKKELEGAAIEKFNSQNLEVWFILNSKIAPEIFNGLNSVSGRSPYKNMDQAQDKLGHHHHLWDILSMAR
jgi:hypothetical protein